MKNELKGGEIFSKNADLKIVVYRPLKSRILALLCSLENDSNVIPKSLWNERNELIKELKK